MRTEEPWRAVPIRRLSIWELTVERITRWTRMGQSIYIPGSHKQAEGWAWKNKYWDREVGR